MCLVTPNVGQQVRLNFFKYFILVNKLIAQLFDCPHLLYMNALTASRVTKAVMLLTIYSDTVMKKDAFSSCMYNKCRLK